MTTSIAPTAPTPDEIDHECITDVDGAMMLLRMAKEMPGILENLTIVINGMRVVGAEAYERNRRLAQEAADAVTDVDIGSRASPEELAILGNFIGGIFEGCEDDDHDMNTAWDLLSLTVDILKAIGLSDLYREFRANC